ncbi:MAG: thiolase family protein [Verrucomicrobiae bacterium]|nr:thiolase family protein [Verrucomicrobiae bacterium]
MKFDEPIFLVAAARTPIGRFGGVLKSAGPVDLAVQVVASFLKPEPAACVGSVVLGQVLQAGAGMNVARQVGLRAGIPRETPAFTVNMVCASGLKAVALAAAAIEEGETGLALAGGVESMSRAPHYAWGMRWGHKLGDTALADAIFADGLTDPTLGLAMGETAERVAETYRVSRTDQDTFALESQRRAAAARDAFAREIVPFVGEKGAVTQDEHPRPDTTREKLAQLKPAFREGGTVTAGNASGINDGAALTLLANEKAAKAHGLRPRARVVACSAVGCDPALMGIGPVGAIHALCAETGWTLDAVDAVEINEAFAAQTLACARELDLPAEKLNRRGGAIALGHPIGCSGARVLVTLLHLLEDLKLRRGIAALCAGGGMGIAMAIEREA